MKQNIITTIFTIITVAICTSVANAQSPTAPAQGFNVFLKNGATFTTSECEGPVALGGNLTLAGNYNFAIHNNFVYQVSGVNIALLVGGKVNYNSGNQFQVLNSGYVKIGDSTGSKVWYNYQGNNIHITPASSNSNTSNPDIELNTTAANLGVSSTNNPVFQSGLIDFNAAFTTMQATATSLSACTDNMVIYNSPNGGSTPIAHTGISSNTQIYTTLTSASKTVLNINGSDLNNITSFTFQNPNGATQAPNASHIWIVNVNAAGTFTWNTPNGLNGSYAPYIIWNFYNTTTLNISGNNTIEGTVFAPYADISKSNNNSNIEGQVIGLSYAQTASGEIHSYNFTQSVTGCGVSSTPTASGFTINTSTQCLSGNSFSFTNTSTGTSLTYSWSFGDGNTSTSTSPSHTYATAGTYSVKLVATGTAGVDSVTHSVTVNPTVAQPAAFTASTSTVLQGQTNVIYTVPNDATVTYNWSYSGTGATFTGTGNSVSVNFATNASAGNISVTATSVAGCGTSAAQSVTLIVNPEAIWICNADTNWNNAANWSCGFVPYATIAVHIPASSPCRPSVTGGSFDTRVCKVDAGTSININCSGTLNTYADIYLDGNITGCGSLVVKGTSCNAIYGHGTVDHFVMNNTCGAIINSADTLHIRYTYTPVTGTCTVNGGLELLSDSNATASIVTNTGSCNYIVGQVTCDKWIHGGRRAFRFIGHPFSNAIPLSQLEQYVDITGSNGAANGFTPTINNNPSAFFYNTLTGNGSSTDDSTGWIPFTSTNGTGANAWNQYEGLRLFFRGAKGQGLGCTACTPEAITIKMSGNLNECDQTVTLATNANSGFNFISNPYPSDIDLSLATRGNAVAANFSVWDPNQGLVGAYVDQPFSSSYILPAYSSFFTKCNSNAGKTITFHETDKTTATPTGNLFKTTSGFGNNTVQLHIVSNGDSVSWDRLLLFFNDQALAGTDALDNTKMINPDLSFYTFSGDNDMLSIDQRPYVNGQVIKLGISTDVDQSYSIRVDDYSLPAGGVLYLHDKYLNQVQELSAGMHYDFSVTSDAASQGDNRFELNVAGTTGIANVAGTSAMKVDMFPNPATSNATISYDAPQRGSTTVTITNIMGQQVYVDQLGQQQTGKVSLPLTSLVSGIYMVTFKCGDLTVTKRLVKE